MRLKDGSRVAVMGGGPAGSLFSYFLLDLAERVDLHLQVDIYEPRDFSISGSPGCNMCAGIVSESLIQMLALEGVNLPSDVVQRGVDTYVLHTRAGSTQFETPFHEKRIGAVFRGAGPLGVESSEWRSFDGYLLDIALSKGAVRVPGRIDEIDRIADGIKVKTRRGQPQDYSLLAVATGVNSNSSRFFEPLNTGYRTPKTTRTFVREYYFGQEEIERHMGSHSIHLFLLDLPGIDFAAIVPKGSYVTVCLLGKDLTPEAFERFLEAPEVVGCMPPAWKPSEFACHCAPRVNVSGAFQPYADRMVFIGDSGVSRLYKDGIGAAYRAAKAAASTAVVHGVGKKDFETHYWRVCRKMEMDNRVGKYLFSAIRLVKPWTIAMRSVVAMVAGEQSKEASNRRMSSILWDIFTGSAPYRDIAFRCFHPAMWSRLLWHFGGSLSRRS